MVTVANLTHQRFVYFRLKIRLKPLNNTLLQEIAEFHESYVKIIF